MTLNEICELIVDCPHSTAKDEGSGYPLIRTPNIGKGRLILDDVHRVSKEVYDKRNARAIPQDDDLILAREAPAGNVAIIKKGEKVCLGQRTVLIRPDKRKVDPDYLTYYILAPQQQYGLLGTANGATVAHVNIPVIKALPVELPDMNTQKRAAGVLKTYDDLIENTQKRLKLLEEMALRFYKEWIINLHFPGHEDMEIVDGVPKKWKRICVNDCLSFHMNGGWGKETAFGKNIHPGHVIRGTDINNIKGGEFSEVPLRYHNDNDIQKRVLKEGDIVFELSNGNINNIGRSLIIDEYILKKCGENTICASFCKFFRPVNRACGLMLYLEIQEMQTSGRMLPFKKQGANGINNFAFDDFLNHELLIPDSEEVFSCFESIMTKMSNCQRQLAVVIEARDRLLPKLMSGEIEL